jgi:DNA invertase Pin-like site-specific DNA recombinase
LLYLRDMDKKDMKYIAYYRVSTDKQGESGLGLEAQRTDVRRFIQPENLDLELTEIESGKKAQRPVLNQAIELCRNNGATLLIAKLDRLARNVSFVSTLMNSGIKFIAVDMPSATELTIHIYSAIAEDEAKRISKRTKDALAVKKTQGIKLGSPQNLTNASRELAIKSIKSKAINNENNIRAKAMINLLKANGLTLQAIANELNASGFKTSKGGQFMPMQIKRLLTC